MAEEIIEQGTSETQEQPQEQTQTQETTQQEPPSKGSKLYKNLISDGYNEKNLGSESQFLQALSDKTKAEKIYNSLLSEGYTEKNLGNKDTFLTTFSQPSPAPKQSWTTSALNPMAAVTKKPEQQPAPVTAPPVKQKEKEKPEIPSDDTFAQIVNAPQFGGLGSAIDYGKYVWNKLAETGAKIPAGTLKGIVRMSAAITDLGARALGANEEVSSAVLDPHIKEADEAARQIKESAKGLELNVDEKRKQDFDNNFIASTVASIPSLALQATVPLGLGFGADAFDTAIDNINNTEAGKKLPESIKTIYGTANAASIAVLSEIGLDKIVGGKLLPKLSSKLTAETITGLLGKSSAPITKDVFEEALKANANKLKNSLIDKASRLGHSAAVGSAFMGANEALNIMSEGMVNKLAKEDVFEPTSFGEDFARILKSGAEGAAFGLTMGGVHIPFGKTDNYIKDRVAESKRPEDIDVIKSDIADNLKSGKINQQQSDIMMNLVDEYAGIHASIPSDVPNKAQVIDKIKQSNDIRQQAQSVALEAQNLHPAFQEQRLKEAETLGKVADDIDNSLSGTPKYKIGEQTVDKDTFINFINSPESDKGNVELSVENDNQVSDLLNKVGKEKGFQVDDIQEEGLPKTTIVNKKAEYDTENITGVQGGLGIGKEPIQAQPVEGRGAQEISGGGILQENVPSSEGKVEEKPQEVDIENKRVNEIGLQPLRALAVSKEQYEKDFADWEKNKKEVNAKYDAELKALKEKQAELPKQEKVGEEVKLEQKGKEEYRSKNLPNPIGDFKAVEVISYTEAEKNKFRPDQQLKFNQGDKYEPVRIVGDPELIELIQIGSREIGNLTGKTKKFIDRNRQKQLEEKFGISAYDANKKAKELAKENRGNVENIIIIGEPKANEPIPTREEAGGTVQSVSEVPEEQKAKTGLQPSTEPISGGKAETTSAVLEQEQTRETDLLLSGEAEKRRKEGKFVKDGVEFNRNEKGVGLASEEGGDVRFTSEPGGGGVVVPFKYKLVEAKDLQPSHQDGIRNPLHFIPEAQPKNRNDIGTLQAEETFANSPRFNELGKSEYAYNGAPVINERGEVIQGNNRSAGLRKGYQRGNDIYRQELLNNAEQFGFTKEQVESMDKPILVREVATSDQGAIELGNYDVKDLETSGKRRLDPVAITRRMPFSTKGKISDILFKGEETLNQAIRSNIKRVMEYLDPYLNQSQRNTIFKNNELTDAGIKDLESVVQQFLFDGGDVALPELYENLSHVQKEGLRKALPYIFSTSAEKSITPEIQEAILALNDFGASKSGNFDAWLSQSDMFNNGMTPREKYSPIAIKIASILESAKSQKEIAGLPDPKKGISASNFAAYADFVNDKPATMFEEAVKGGSKKDAIKEIFKTEYDESQRPEISTRGAEEIPTKEKPKPQRIAEKGKVIEPKPAIEPATKPTEPAAEPRRAEKTYEGEKPVEKPKGKQPGKYESMMIEAGKKIDAIELPSFLKAKDIEGIKKAGLGEQELKDLLKESMRNMGKLMDMGVEFSQAVKASVKNLVKAQGEENRDAIEKGFAAYYRENAGVKEQESIVKEEEPKYVGVSHKEINETAKRLGLPKIERGQFLTPEEYANRGRKLIEGGVDPIEIGNQFKEDGLVSPDRISIVRSHLETLIRNQDAALEKYGINSKEYKDALKQVNDWTKEVVKPMGTQSGASMTSLQGSRDLNTDSFSYVKRQVEELIGTEASKEQDAKIKELTDNNKNLIQKVADIEKKLAEATNKAFNAKEPKVKFSDKLRTLADKIRNTDFLDKLGLGESAAPGAETKGISFNMKEAVAKVLEHMADGVDRAEAIARAIKEFKVDKKEIENILSKVLEEKSNLDELQKMFLDKKDNKFSFEEAKAIWEYAKSEYLDKGISYKDMISRVAEDIGLTWRQVAEAITSPKDVKRISDEMWKKRSDLLKNQNATKRWIEEQNQSPTWKAVKKFTNAFRGAAIFGHGGIFVGTHAGMNLFSPSRLKHVIPAFFNGYKFAYGKRSAYEMAMEELKNSENYITAQRAGLQNNPDVFNVEEYQKYQTALGRLGMVGQQGFNAIKVLRQQLFDAEYNKLTDAEKADPKVAESIARLMNLATGATNLKMPEWIGEVTFAGGMEAARWGKLLRSPSKAAEVAIKAITSPEKASTADKVFAKIWARRIGEQLGTFATALAVNAAIQNYLNPKNKVNITNPNDPDWLKFKIDNVAIDPTSGMLQPVNFIKGVANISTKPQEELKGRTRLAKEGEFILKYVRGKLSPFYGTAVEQLVRTDYRGNVLPYFSDKPQAGKHKLTYLEYALSKAPLPVAEAMGEMYNAAAENDADRPTTNQVLDGILSGALSGGTGFKVKVGETKPFVEKTTTFEVYQKYGNKKREATKEELSKSEKQADELYSKALDQIKKSKTGIYGYDKEGKVKRWGYNKYGELTLDKDEIKKNGDYSQLSASDKEELHKRLKTQKTKEARDKIKY